MEHWTHFLPQLSSMQAGDSTLFDESIGHAEGILPTLPTLDTLGILSTLDTLDTLLTVDTLDTIPNLDPCSQPGAALLPLHPNLATQRQWPVHKLLTPPSLPASVHTVPIFGELLKGPATRTKIQLKGKVVPAHVTSASAAASTIPFASSARNCCCFISLPQQLTPLWPSLLLSLRLSKPF